MGTRRRDIVVGYDASPGAASALAWAARTARHQGRGLRVVVVVSAMDPVVGDFHARNVQRAEEQRAQACEELRDAGLPYVEVKVLPGPTVQVLLRACEEAAMLVVGGRAREHTASPVDLVGHHLAREAPCPVVVVPPGTGAEGEGFVVGVDGSPASLEALRFAAALAETSTDTVTAVYAYRPHVTPGDDHDPPRHPHAARKHDVAEAHLREWTCEALGDDRSLVVEQIVFAGHPDRVLTEHAAEAALLVVGSRGRDPVAALVLGSTSRHALDHARCPVAVVTLERTE